MNFAFVLIDRSKNAVTSNGEKLTPEILAAIAKTLDVQLNRDFGSEYGGNYTVRAASLETDYLPTEIPFFILSTLTDAPGAIAYHSTAGNGQPMGYDALTLSDSLTGPGNSLSVAISHELLETSRDPGANEWVDDGSGMEFATEVCDPFESESYSWDDKIYVSNFALRSYFIPGTAGPYSYMESSGLDHAIHAKGPLQQPAGYQIVRNVDENGVHTAEIKGGMTRRALHFLKCRRNKRLVHLKICLQS